MQEIDTITQMTLFIAYVQYETSTDSIFPFELPSTLLKKNCLQKPDKNLKKKNSIIFRESK